MKKVIRAFLLIAILFVATVHPRLASASDNQTADLNGVGGVQAHCWVRADYPHSSGHNRGHVNFVGHFGCYDGFRVQLAVLVAALYYNGRMVAQSDPVTAAWTDDASQQSNAPCQTGYWQGVLFYSLFTAPKSDRPWITSNIASNLKYISCERS